MRIEWTFICKKKKKNPKTWVPFPQSGFGPSLLKLARWFWTRRIWSKYFWNFETIFPWERTWHFFWIDMKLLHPRMLCAKFMKLDQWFWRGRFLNFVTVFSLFYIRKGFDPSFELTWIPLILSRIISSKFGVKKGLVVLEEAENVRRRVITKNKNKIKVHMHIR